HGVRPAWSGAKPLTLADEVALVEPILNAAGPVHLVGHSYGGAVALKAAALHPSAVASVTVFEPVLFRWLFDAAPDSGAAHQVMALAETMRKYLVRGDAYRAAAPFLNYWAGVGSWEAMPIERRDAAAARMRSVLAHFDALFGDPLSPADLRRVCRPMLFLSGTRSVASMRTIVRLLRTALPDASHEAFPGMGPMGPVSHAAEVNRRIVHFVDRILADEGGTSDRLRAAA
ncbi:MAG: alpha/beta fold hydrolase, partial [Burkholderiaceae bacterium]